MIQLENISVTAGSFSLSGVSFTVPTGEYGVLMGKTGCGKTTVLETICGLKTVTSGIVRLMGEDVTALKPSQRGIGFVPQDGALFSSMTVYDHLAFALTIRKMPKAEMDQRVSELADQLGIAHLLQRYPQGLSGGESQRVALGRALSFQPRVLCMDEPLSALDDYTRNEMCGLLESIKIRYGITILHITHRVDEAKRLADRLFLMENRTVRQLTRDEIHALKGISVELEPEWIGLKEA